jgi:hypothetical protein
MTNLPQQQHLKTLRRVLFSQLATIQGKTLTEETVESLLMTCGDSMLLAALDLVDSADGEYLDTTRNLHLLREPLRQSRRSALLLVDPCFA